MPKEIGLLLHCLESSTIKKEQIRFQSPRLESINWDSFLSLVDRHRVAAPVFAVLRQFDHGSVPEGILARSHHLAMDVTNQVLLKTTELARLLNVFESKSIQALPLKGPVVSLQAYGNLGQRHVGDLDILVRPEDVAKAGEILHDHGYLRVQPEIDLTPRQFSSYVRMNHHFGYFCHARNTMVELHWRFGAVRQLFPLPFQAMWKNRQSVRVGNVAINALSLEHTLLLLCAHGAIHCWGRLFWLNDIVHILKNGRITDWESLMKEAERLGVVRMLAEGILLAHMLLGAAVPQPVQEVIKTDQMIARLADRSIYIINSLGYPAFRPLSRPYIYTKLHGVALRGSPKYKWSYCLSLIEAPSADWLEFPLPDFLFPLYFFIRPFTWIYRHTSRKQGG